ncbi:bifunctional AAA ATPase [Babesia duncani]|uniref:Dihydroorotate dehydrogenase (quinone), mitochondrial n=1 Tax=Babesia duncani TaxID=323732 RepID=A0AAD9UN32_9APIC|nr:bifunctional AAA ATPase [Babesia duncani]
MSNLTLTVGKLPNESLTYTNCRCRAHESAKGSDVLMSFCARQLIGVTIGEALDITPWFEHSKQSQTVAIASKIGMEVAPFKTGVAINVDFDHLEILARETLMYHILHLSQTVALLVQGIQLKLTVVAISSANDGQNVLLRGKLTDATELDLLINHDGKQQHVKRSNGGIFKRNFKFVELGIGGLDNEFADIFRRAFASRIYPPELLKQLGISHVKGLILYGPPGTGKTLIARQISKALNCAKLKTVNGPEVMSRFFGQSEENVRNLFTDAEEEYARMGDYSGLHIIIFDEIDSICQRRGSDTSGTAARDSIVNQLLSKIDGVDSLNNILLIGMTNRLDMIDEALLRPGRFEVHIEVGLPDEFGRAQILKIHTRVMRESKRLSDCVDLNDICAKTKNYSGAELEGLVKCAVSYAINRHVDAEDITKPKDIDHIIVKRQDFENALLEVKPAYGVDSDNLCNFMLHGIIPYGKTFHAVLETCTILADQVAKSEKTPVLSVLLQGAVGCGKSALAAHVATMANFPFVKVISPENLIGLSELGRVNAIHRIFDDAHKTPQSLVILDDIERLIDYSPIGPRFSNSILQCLLVMIKKAPSHGRRVFVIGTSSEGEFLEMANVSAAFTVTVNVPLVEGPMEIQCALEEAVAAFVTDATGTGIARPGFPLREIQRVANSPLLLKIGIKRLMLALEIAVQKTLAADSPSITAECFFASLDACGYSALDTKSAGVGLYWLSNVDCVLYDWCLSLMRRFLTPQCSHDLSIKIAKMGLLPKDYSINDPIIHTSIGPIKLYNPIGLAAGYDKQANVTNAMLRMGFGFVEVGTIVPQPQFGNPKPVLFRLDESEAIINRCGFNSVGLSTALERLKQQRREQLADPLISNSIIGVSVGKNKEGEIIANVKECIQAVAPYADYIAINVSSPNTPNLRDNQQREPLSKLLEAARSTINVMDVKWENTTKTRPLLFLKISPDIDDAGLLEIAKVALEHKIDAIIATNTTVQRPLELHEKHAQEIQGGLSGKPLYKRSKQVVHKLYKACGDKIPIVACGGISNGAEALEMIEAGATCCQLYTAMVFGGPKTPSLVKKQLARLLAAKGYKNINSAIGAAHGELLTTK